MKNRNAILTPAAALLLLTATPKPGPAANAALPSPPPITILNPPERDFYAKQLDYHGIKIKAHQVVSDEAMFEAWRRIDMLLTNLPMVLSNLVAGGSELHIIGKDQVTTDLPEWQHDKHVPLSEYQGLTRDRRTRGMGGIISSCGEENLLKLPTDRYRGRDICIHEFAHGIFGSGIQESVRQMFRDQLQRSLQKDLWVNSYAASGNGGEFLSEMTMWYFGTRGDLSMQGPRPADGRDGLKNYDPDTFKLVDDFYSGRIEITQVEPRARRQPSGTNTVLRGRGDAVARAVVATLSSYKVGETKLNGFFGDAGIVSTSEGGTNGWHVTRLNTAAAQASAAPQNEPGELQRFRVFFRDPRSVSPPSDSNTTTATTAQSTNAVPAQGRRGGRGGAMRDQSLADLEFKSGVLSTFTWNN
jgi:alpha-glucosidase